MTPKRKFPNMSTNVTVQILYKARTEPLTRDEIVAALEGLYFLTPEKFTPEDFTVAAQEAASHFSGKPIERS